MRLIKRLMELTFAVFIITLFAKNQGIEFGINYYGLKEPIKMAFWELVIFCVSLGILISAIGDFITQLRWMKEKRQLIKRDKDHQNTVDGLNDRIQALEKENEKLRLHPASLPPSPPIPEVKGSKETKPIEKKPEYPKS
jgi:hypothetical protein